MQIVSNGDSLYEMSNLFSGKNKKKNISISCLLKYLPRVLSVNTGYPSADSKRAVVSFWQKNVHNTGNHLEDKACPVKVWLGKLTSLDMTQLYWLGHKTSAETNNTKYSCYILRNSW